MVIINILLFIVEPSKQDTPTGQLFKQKMINREEFFCKVRFKTNFLCIYNSDYHQSYNNCILIDCANWNNATTDCFDWCANWNNATTVTDCFDWQPIETVQTLTVLIDCANWNNATIDHFNWLFQFKQCNHWLLSSTSLIIISIYDYYIYCTNVGWQYIFGHYYCIWLLQYWCWTLYIFGHYQHIRLLQY